MRVVQVLWRLVQRGCVTRDCAEVACGSARRQVLARHVDERDGAQAEQALSRGVHEAQHGLRPARHDQRWLACGECGNAIEAVHICAAACKRGLARVERRGV